MRPDWMQQAACKGKPTDWWFPVGEDVTAARALCSSCPVRTACFEFGERNREEGMWGGVMMYGYRRAPSGLPRGRPRPISIVERLEAELREQAEGRIVS